MTGVRPWRFALLVLSDKAAAGEREDECVAAMRAALPTDFEVVLERVLPDDQRLIEKTLIDICDGGSVDCVFTSGGTGLGPRDVTPQATRAVIDYDVPGIAEWMRAGSIKEVPTAVLSRAVAGVRGRTLIVNLPGSPRGARDMASLIAGVLPHALAVLTGAIGEHSRDQVR